MTCAVNPELGPLADFVLAADTGPEALAGSTRLKAGTAQKMMLNSFSTALMIRLGKTWSNLMVSMLATNEKLRARTVRILMEATGQGEEPCRAALAAADGDLKVALVSMLTGSGPARHGTPSTPPAEACAPPSNPSPSSAAQAHEHPHTPTHPAPPPPSDQKDHPMKVRPRHLIAALALAMLPITACAPGSSSTAAGKAAGTDAPGAPRPRSLKVWSWRPEDVEAYKKIFAAYEEKNCVKVDFQAFKNTEYNQILTTGLTGSNGPDVVQARAYGALQPLIAGGNLTDITGKVEGLSSMDKTIVAGAKGKADGKIYGVPFATQTMQVFYNKKIFKERGRRGAQDAGTTSSRSTKRSRAPA